MRAFVLLSLVALLVGGCSSSPTDEKAQPDSTDSSTPAALSGPLDVDTAASCVETYTPDAVANRGFAFDGTVENIGPGTTDRPGKGELNYSAVTFTVEHWVTGGSGDTVTIDMPPPGESPQLSESTPTYDVGTRLLVSGESRWGEGILEDGLAWGCGFTRYYDAKTASAWLAASD